MDDANRPVSEPRLSPGTPIRSVVEKSGSGGGEALSDRSLTPHRRSRSLFFIDDDDDDREIRDDERMLSTSTSRVGNLLQDTQ